VRVLCTGKLAKGWTVTESATAREMLQLLGVDADDPLGTATAAAAGGSASSRPAAHGFDLLITDDIFSFDAAELKGRDAVRILRTAGLTDLPVIICSGGADGPHEMALADSGAHRVWGKPIPSWADGTMQRELSYALRAPQAKANQKSE
jgi:CheY-like chemotaxis protein